MPPADPPAKPGTEPGPAFGPPEATAVRAFGKYFLVRKLAEGGMAEIFLAKQVGAEGFERNVVIKRMLQHLSSVPDFVGMFLDEARLAARLAHQNIIQINDLGLADGCYFICMEYLAGEDFSTILRTAARRRSYVPIHVVLRIIADSAHGLHFAHEFTDEQGRPLNIVHRDISPSNIYVTYQGQVKLLDFGIAKAESRITNTTAGVVKGKYMYMSPEQARGDAVDRRADVFSLGVSLYEGLTNVRPFARDNDLAILNAVLSCDFKPPRQVRPDLPVEVEQVVTRAMAASPDERYQTAAEMAADLERLLAAWTSGQNVVSVGAYLRDLFGEERFNHKTRIPTLVSLAQSGVDVPGFSNPYMPKTDPGDAVLTDAGPTKVVAPPGAKARSSRGAVMLVALAAVAAAGLGAYVVLRGPGRAVEAEPPPVEQATQTTPAEDGGAPPQVAEADAGSTEAPQPSDAGARVAVAVGRGCGRVDQLTVKDIERSVLKGKSRILQCFEEHRSELPGQSGKVNVTVTIAPSGKVASAVSEMKGRVGKCLESRVKALCFPAYRGEPLQVKIPFVFEPVK